MLRIPGKHFSLVICSALAVFLTATAVAQSSNDSIRIVQSRGADQRVRYTELQKYGPWDDRNYDLTAQDLKYLSADEHTLNNQLPVFFRVELRKEWPSLRKSGPAQYPRAALQLFGIRHGGLMQNGRIAVDRRELAKKPVPVGKEVQLNQILGANEITVEINPVNSQQVIAGANNAGGQEMYFSTDGGVTWTIQGVLPNTCCDPTIEWSSDGSVAYVGALSGDIGVSTWRSFDGGQTWVDRVDLTLSGSDKEFIHVDHSPTSPFQDNLYVTYHNSNTMQFARSTDQGSSYAISAFNTAPFGIGSDITTDSAGNIYYAYAAFGTQTIEVLKSTDGGDSFGAPVSVATTNGAFDYPIPSQESRFAWTYAVTDADRSAGPFAGSVYVSWTDTVDPESGVAADNHTRVYVAYSRDGGATWNMSTPHSIADMDTVDRWNQWMTVDDFGNVHVVFYDTRNSVDRTGVDLYYSYSIDGGVTWATAERVSSATSANLTDLQEFGDYNGLAVLQETVISTWTDNRDGPPNAKDVYADDAPNVVAEPGFTLRADPVNQQVCAPSALDDITVSVGSILGFVEPVTLNLANLPAGITGGFSPTNPVTPGQPANTTFAQMSVGSVATGDYSFDIVGSALGVNDKSIAIDISAFDSVPSGATLLNPVDGAIGVSTAPLLLWTLVSGAINYTVEIDDDPAFGSIDFTTQTTDSSVAPNVTLSSDTTYYWRVRAENPCGAGVESATFSFTTNLEICRAGFGFIPDGDPNGTSDTLVVNTAGQLTDLDILLQVTHTYVGDLIFRLVHENTGTSVLLIDRPGVPALGNFGCSGDNIDATLDDEGTAPVEDECAANPAIAGNLIPHESLSAFDFEDLSGSWRLEFSDNEALDLGTLDQWCLVPSLLDPNADADDDGVTNALDLCQGTAAGAAVDAVGCSDVQVDSDADGFCNPGAQSNGPSMCTGSDVFPDDPTEWSDLDRDGIGDNSDPDRDGDGVDNDQDVFPDDRAESSDFDGDGIGDRRDPDRDGDGVHNAQDAFQYDPTEWSDLDLDGIGDNSDPDRDGDGVNNAQDVFPDNPAESSDLDGDGIGDNADPDDDGDGQSDFHEAACGSDPSDGGSTSPDADGNGIPDCVDTNIDSDNDGVLDKDDLCANTAIGAAVDANGCSAEQRDDDGDGVVNGIDNCTNAANTDQRDTDGDGFGSLCDADLNNDGIVNRVDLDLFRSVLFSADADADFNGDGVVNRFDLSLLKSRFLQPPGPSALAP